MASAGSSLPPNKNKLKFAGIPHFFAAAQKAVGKNNESTSENSTEPMAETQTEAEHAPSRLPTADCDVGSVPSYVACLMTRGEAEAAVDRGKSVESLSSLVPKDVPRASVFFPVTRFPNCELAPKSYSQF